MNLRLSLLLGFLLASGSVSALADGPEISVTRLDLLDEYGYFTPAFKDAVHDFVDARQALNRARANTMRFRGDIPNLQKQSTEASAETVRLRAELALYQHPEDSDFDALDAAMKNPAVSPTDRLAMAQAFVWSYPTDPHLADAAADLKKIQDQMTAERKGAADTAAAQVVARESLIQRAQTGDLSLAEWQEFLHDMSQEDLLTNLGQPQKRETDYWIYAGNRTTDPETKKRTGIQINFNGTRVLSVAPASP